MGWVLQKEGDTRSFSGCTSSWSWAFLTLQSWSAGRRERGQGGCLLELIIVSVSSTLSRLARVQNCLFLSLALALTYWVTLAAVPMTCVMHYFQLASLPSPWFSSNHLTRMLAVESNHRSQFVILGWTLNGSRAFHTPMWSISGPWEIFMPLLTGHWTGVQLSPLVTQLSFIPSSKLLTGQQSDLFVLQIS